MSLLTEALDAANARIAELEAENAELKTVLMNDSRPQADLHEGCRHYIAQCEAHNKHLIELLQKKEPPPSIVVQFDATAREQIAALVKGLEWTKGYGTSKLGVYFLMQDDDKRFYAEYFNGNNNDRQWTCAHNDSIHEVRAAAEAHHRKTVLNLLNLPA